MIVWASGQDKKRNIHITWANADGSNLHDIDGLQDLGGVQPVFVSQNFNDPWLGYVGTRAIGQMGFININAGPPGTVNAGRPLAIKFGLVSDINEIIPYGDTTYDALQAQFTRRWASSMFGAAYTLWMYKRVIFGVIANAQVKSLVDVKAREGLVLALVAVAILGMGLYPQAFAGVLHHSVSDLLALAIKSKI